MKRHGLFFATALVLALGDLTTSGYARASEAGVMGVEVARDRNGWRFDVTVLHDDEGWDHYADKWDVIGPDGTVLATRVLLHPHETEQPFTRSLGGVEIPDGVTEVEIRAHDNVHGYGGKVMKVALPES